MEYHSVRLSFDKTSKKNLFTGSDYGILLVVRGTADVNGKWRIGTDEMMVCKPHQTLSVEYPGGKIPLAVYWVCISKELMQEYSTKKTDLLASFQVNPEPIVRIRGQSELLMLLKRLSSQLMELPGETSHYASDLLEEGCLKMFISLILRACILSDRRRVRKGGHLALDEVFSYIHVHLTEDLSLEILEREFYVSRQHLMRQFKQRTGMTVHQYIVKARLDLSREYIEQGLSINAVCRKCGFGSYNHFFRAFKQEYGITPKEYYHMIKQENPAEPVIPDQTAEIES